MYSQNRSFNQQPPQQPVRQRAVVIGGSIAGLMAARVLSDHFDTVTVIERTTFANGVEFPKGAPQARHPHALFIRGEQILERYFPGFRDAMLAGGAQRINLGRDLKIRFPAGWVSHYETDLEAIAASRRLLDHTVYQHASTNQQITFKANSDVLALCGDDNNERVIGVQVRNRVTGMIEEIPAEFVVDASGRNSKAPNWLSQLGYMPPVEQTVNAFPGYSTRTYAIPDGYAQKWQTLYIMPNPPHITRGAVVMPMEGNQWHVSLIGMDRDYPPTDEAGFLAFAESLATPDVYDAIRHATPTSPISGYRRAENRMRRFDQMPRYLEGFVALGDAVYALNPVYGQGMTLAAIATELLDSCLSAHAGAEQADFVGLAKSFQQQLKQELAIPWQNATNEDMRWASTTGKQALDPVSKLLGRYFKLALQAMPHSVKVTDAFFRVQQMIAPPTLMLRPDILAAVVGTNLTHRAP